MNNAIRINDSDQRDDWLTNISLLPPITFDTDSEQNFADDHALLKSDIELKKIYESRSVLNNSTKYRKLNNSINIPMNNATEINAIDQELNNYKKTLKQAKNELLLLNNNADKTLIINMKDNLTDYERDKLPNYGIGSGNNCHRCRKQYAKKNIGYDRYIYYCKKQFNLAKDDKEWKCCRKRFCDLCLLRLFNEHPTKNPLEPIFLSWKCPSCRGICLCSECIIRKKTPAFTDPSYSEKKVQRIKSNSSVGRHRKSISTLKENASNSTLRKLNLVNDHESIAKAELSKYISLVQDHESLYNENIEVKYESQNKMNLNKRMLRKMLD